VLPWVFTALFGALAIYSLLRAATDLSRPILAVGHLFHVAMSADMVAMSWPWWDAVPWRVELAVFVAATGWYVLLTALAAARARIDLGPHPWWHQLMHAVMMAAMVWMVAGMPPGEHHHELSALATGTGAALTAALIVFGILTAAQFVRDMRRREPGGIGLDHVAATAMNFGMAGMCALMF